MSSHSRSRQYSRGFGLCGSVDETPSERGAARSFGAPKHPIACGRGGASARLRNSHAGTARGPGHAPIYEDPWQNPAWGKGERSIKASLPQSSGGTIVVRAVGCRPNDEGRRSREAGYATPKIVRGTVRVANEQPTVEIIDHSAASCLWSIFQRGGPLRGFTSRKCDKANT